MLSLTRIPIAFHSTIRMPEPSKPEKKPDPSSNSTPSNSWLLYVILALLFIGGTVSIVLSSLVQPIPYPDLIQLIEKTKYAEGGLGTLEEGYSGTISIVADTGTVEISNLRDVQVDETTISGHVDVKSTAKGKPSSTRLKVSFETTKDNSNDTTRQVREKLDRARISWTYKPGPSLLTQSIWFFVLPLLLVTGILMFAMRRMGGIGSPMQFGRSRGKLYANEAVGVTFDDVAGIDEAVEEVREVVDFLKHPEKYQKLGGRIPHGVLLVGPPGTGKTLLAKAIAGEAGVPFYSLSGSDFVEMFVGVGAARVRDMFQQATAKAPSIIFIDELDALGKSRAGNVPGSHDEREQTLNALLVEMDGFAANVGVIVIAATNRPETLDPALLRAGRFDRNVLVDRPDKQGREEILKVHVKGVKLGSNVELKQVAAITPGFVGADLANLVNEAALLAARKGKSDVGKEEFNDGVERVTAGLEKKSRIMSEDEKRRVAYHEAGHALAQNC